MAGQPDNGGDRHWAILGTELPDDLSARRILLVGEDGGDEAAAFRERGAADVVTWEPPADIQADEGFDLVYCRDALQRDPHPMNVLSRLWHLSSEGALVLLESRIIREPERSRFARFVAGAQHGDSSPEWLPGRLALRWSVETSGFDVECWIEPELKQPGDPGQASAYLRATRVARQPAIDLAIPDTP